MVRWSDTSGSDGSREFHSVNNNNILIIIINYEKLLFLK